MSTKSSSTPQLGVLVDLTQCIGCGSCTVACKMHNANKWIEDRAATDGENATLADENWTVVQKSVVTDAKGREAWRFAKHQCLHCKDPACVSACPSRAFQKTDDGPVVYYPRNCIGCRYCMIGCPFNIPKFEWDKQQPMLTKCMMCAGRVAEGLAPACVTVCPTSVMKFGEIDELLKEAKAKIAANPGKYIEHIYGEEEAGGTSWIYLSDVPFEKLGFKDNVPKHSLPANTADFMHQSPIYGGIWGIVLAGLYLITRRRCCVKASAEDAETLAEAQPETKKSSEHEA